mgnify:FL=1
MIATIAASVILASSGGGDGGGELAFLLAGPAGGIAFYTFVYRYYRNQDKTHRFEQETIVERKADITGDDRKVGENNGTRDGRINGDNIDNHRQRVRAIE